MAASPLIRLMAENPSKIVYRAGTLNVFGRVSIVQPVLFMRWPAVTVRTGLGGRCPLALFYIRLAATLDPDDGLLDHFRRGRRRGRLLAWLTLGWVLGCHVDSSQCPRCR